MPQNYGRRNPPKLPLDHDPAAVGWARKAKGWSQVDLAREIGISQSHMSEIESGKRNAPPHLLLKFANALNCPVSMLERKSDPAGQQSERRMATKRPNPLRGGFSPATSGNG